MSTSENTLEQRPPSDEATMLLEPSNTRNAVLSILLVVFISMNLRPLLTSVAPVLQDIQRDLSISNFWISILMTVPVICLGIFGPFASVLSRRLGLEGVIVAALAFAFMGATLRSFGIVPLYLGTVMIGASMSLLGILTPVLIKRDFPQKVGPMMGLFAMILGFGAAVSTASAVPIKEAFGGSWRIGLSVWIMPVVVAAVIAIAMLRSGINHGRTHAAKKYTIMHDPISWQLTAFFALIASSAYAAISWGPSMLAARGLDAQTCGFIMSVFFLAQMPSGLIVPMIAGKMRDQRLITSAMVILASLGMIAFLFAPTWSLLGVAVIVGIGQGGGFAVALTLIVLRSADQQVAAKLSSVVQSIGYVVGGLVGPFAVGLLHDFSGNWSVVAIFYTVVGVLSLAFGYGASRNHKVQKRCKADIHL
ncbi:MFS transporter (plasmid) [Shinella sp. H4-D48]|uniref:MFS transporter n=1 Tax=Shinella sp. H4-D48 TaxID=2925841 RepID=UPI001F53663C|nr:MFS transporter [Shinella sp. H4-D48]UNK39995.1 MFS transporter [Shinella sp. H4-D48]